MWKDALIAAAVVVVALYSLMTLVLRSRAVLALERLVRIAEREP